MAKIEDIEKLRPELLGKSVAELERQMAELQMALDRKKDEEKKAALAQVVIEANNHQENLVEALKFLEHWRLLPDDVKAAYTTTSGVFNPGIKHKEVTADRIILREEQAKKVKKPRRKKGE